MVWDLPQSFLEQVVLYLAQPKLPIALLFVQKSWTQCITHCNVLWAPLYVLILFLF